MAENDTTAQQKPVMENEKKERVFQVPQKLIKNAEEIKIWESSETYYDLLGFINSACVCVQGKSLKQPCQVSPAVQKILDVLSDMEKLLIETPPILTVQRFGNQAFRSWFEKVKDVSISVVKYVNIIMKMFLLRTHCHMLKGFSQKILKLLLQNWFVI